MKNSYKYFENRDCQYFPCHNMEGDFNCLFCYCPLYRFENCPGDNHYIEKGDRRIKVCTDCTFPHDPNNYEMIMAFLKEQ